MGVFSDVFVLSEGKKQLRYKRKYFLTELRFQKYLFMFKIYDTSREIKFNLNRVL